MPNGVCGTLYGGSGFSAVSSPSLVDAFVLRSSLPSHLRLHASFQTWPCHALTPHQVSPPRLGPCHILGSHKGWFLRNRCLPLFFPSNARWLSPGRLSSRKDNCILQIHRINAVATSVMTTMCIQKRTELDRYIIHWAVTVQNKNKTNNQNLKQNGAAFTC